MAKNVEPAVKACNFKKLYNKQYGDIAKMTKAHKYTPEQVFDLAVRYFTWAEENHIQAAETASFQGDVYESKIHKPRVFTLNGFRLFAGLSASVLEKWRREPGFSDVMDFIDGVVYEQKFQLAANNIVNAGFIGKEIGIEKPATVTIENNTISSVDAVTAEEVKEAVIDILEKI